MSAAERNAELAQGALRAPAHALRRARGGRQHRARQ